VPEQDTRDAIGQLSDEVLRFVRLGARAKGMLNTAEFGAEFSALMLLFPLCHQGPMRVTDLAELKGADPSTISRQAAQLVKAGLVRREADPGDGRASQLAATELGWAARARLRDARQEMLTRALEHWPAETVRVFTDLFEEFNSSVEALLRVDAATPARETA
jgi:DNA-binding MarR family transcriptional regulator